MGWRGRGGGRSGRWPGRGPFSNLPPWQRPGWLYGYGRGLGYGYSRYGGYSPYACARFPWLPRRWWADPSHRYNWPYPPTPDPNAELERLEAEKEALMRDIEEMKKHIAEGTTPSIWPRPMATPYGIPPYMAPSPEQEKELLEQQRNYISTQIEVIKKRLEELEKGE
jgi:hypothetical protein